VRRPTTRPLPRIDYAGRADGPPQALLADESESAPADGGALEAVFVSVGRGVPGRTEGMVSFAVQAMR
jgi:hypothetical protein